MKTYGVILAAGESRRFDADVNKLFYKIKDKELVLYPVETFLNNKSIDLFHYDSDKSYSGKTNAMKILNSKLNSKTIIIYDDIQDNFHFRDYVKKNQKSFCILEFEGKYLGILNYEVLFTKDYKF